MVGGVLALAVDRGGGRLARPDLAVDHPGHVPVQPRQRIGGVQDLGATSVGGDGAGVTDLPTAFGVEGRVVEEDGDLAVLAGEHVEHLSGGLVLLPPGELVDPNWSTMRW